MYYLNPSCRLKGSLQEWHNILFEVGTYGEEWVLRVDEDIKGFRAQETRSSEAVLRVREWQGWRERRGKGDDGTVVRMLRSARRTCMLRMRGNGKSIDEAKEVYRVVNGLVGCKGNVSQGELEGNVETDLPVSSQCIQ